MCGGKKTRKRTIVRISTEGAKNCPFFSIDFLFLGDSFVFGITFARERNFFFCSAKKKKTIFSFLHADSGMRDGVTPNHVSINCQLWNRKSIKLNAVAIL